MAERLELGPATAPATVLESESMGGDRRVRGFHIGDFGHGKRRSFTAATAAMATASEAHCGELAGGRESEGRWLGKVEEGREVLTAKAIELRWSNAGDRRGGLFVQPRTEELDGPSLGKGS